MSYHEALEYQLRLQNTSYKLGHSPKKGYSSSPSRQSTSNTTIYILIQRIDVSNPDSSARLNSCTTHIKVNFVRTKVLQLLLTVVTNSNQFVEILNLEISESTKGLLRFKGLKISEFRNVELSQNVLLPTHADN